MALIKFCFVLLWFICIFFSSWGLKPLRNLAEPVVRLLALKTRMLPGLCQPDGCPLTSGATGLGPAAAGQAVSSALVPIALGCLEVAWQKHFDWDTVNSMHGMFLSISVKILKETLSLSLVLRKRPGAGASSLHASRKDMPLMEDGKSGGSKPEAGWGAEEEWRARQVSQEPASAQVSQANTQGLSSREETAGQHLWQGKTRAAESAAGRWEPTPRTLKAEGELDGRNFLNQIFWILVDSIQTKSSSSVCDVCKAHSPGSSCLSLPLNLLIGLQA